MHYSCAGRFEAFCTRCVALQQDGEAMEAKAIARDKDIFEQISTLESTVSDIKENAFQSKEELTDRVESCRSDVSALKEHNENKVNEVNDFHAKGSCSAGR